jgi:DNA-directed RNA polymerase specialized sigma24 family protein
VEAESSYVPEIRFADLGTVTSADAAEATALVGEEHRHLLRAIRTLPSRQREALA